MSFFYLSNPIGEFLMRDYREDGIRIKVARLRKNLKQYEVANALGVAERTVSAWECGRESPTTISAIQLAKLLEVKPDELFANRFGINDQII